MTEHDHQLRIVDDLWRQLSAVDAARDLRARRDVARRRTLRTIAITALALLGAAAVAVAARALLFGAAAPVEIPLPGSLGTFGPGSSRLLSVRVADADKGPAWGLRVLVTTKGDGCLQTGRVVNGRLVALGVAGAFGNDGKAHTLPLETEGCDATHGKPPLGQILGTGITSRAATVTPSCLTAQDARAIRETVRFDRALLARLGSTLSRSQIAKLRASLRRAAHPPPRCRAADRRAVMIGLAGPQATTATVLGVGSKPIVERLRPRDFGGYLFVLQPDDVHKARLYITYRNGVRCRTSTGLVGPERFRPSAACTPPPGITRPRP